MQFFDDSRCAQRVHSEEHIVGLVLRAALSAFQGAVIFTTFINYLFILWLDYIYLLSSSIMEHHQHRPKSKLTNLNK